MQPCFIAYIAVSLSDGVNLMIAMLLFAVGVYLTIYLKFMPVKHIGRAFRTVLSSRGEGGQITAFSSLCTTLGATIGIGNIVGVASAVAVGGPGALFWMLAAAFFGMTTKYAENLLGALYRRKDKSGTFLGGPFYYIRFGLGERYRLLANVFAVSCLLAGILGMGTVTQSNSIYGAVSALFADHISDTEIVKILTAGALTLLTGIVIFGGGKRIAKVSELLVPLMSAAYIVLCLVILSSADKAGNYD